MEFSTNRLRWRIPQEIAPEIALEIAPEIKRRRPGMIDPMPTDLPQPRDPQHPGRRGIQPPAGDETSSRPPPPPLQSIFAFVTLAALLTLILLPVLGQRGGRSEPFQVAISPVRVEAAGSLAPQHLELLRAALVDGAERHLSAREGLLWTTADATSDAPADASAAETDADAARQAQEAGADEALVFTVSCDSVCRGAVRRLRAVDGSTTWQRPRFVLPFDDLTQVEEVLGDHLNIAYLKFARREGAPKLFARDVDYRSYLEIRRQMDGTSTPARLADGLVEVRRRSPRFFATYLFEARLRAAAGADDETVAALLLEAHRIAPGDPRPLVDAVPVLLRLDRALEARDLLTELESLVPKHPQLAALEQRVAARTAAD